MKARLRWWHKLFGCPEPVCPDIPDDDLAWCRFSSDEDNTIQHAINFVDRCEPGTEVLLAAYSFTVLSLSDALIKAHLRGCIVKVIVEGTRSSRQAKCIVDILQAAGVPIKQDKVPIYESGKVLRNPSGDIEWAYKGSTLQHNKYIVEVRPDGTGALFTGSFNFSKSAEGHWENILITRIKSIVANYRNNFLNSMWDNTRYFDFIPREENVIYRDEIVDCGDPDLWD
jgi:phosphatidylserine/phosphatidylglycerophosphate/cardiolipin synthase-like enzyme